MRTFTLTEINTGGGCTALSAQFEAGTLCVFVTEADDARSPDLTGTSNPLTIGIYDDRNIGDCLLMLTFSGWVEARTWMTSYETRREEDIPESELTDPLQVLGRVAYLMCKAVYAMRESAVDDMIDAERANLGLRRA
jgi:hypothetical protein